MISELVFMVQCLTSTPTARYRQGETDSGPVLSVSSREAASPTSWVGTQLVSSTVPWLPVAPGMGSTPQSVATPVRTRSDQNDSCAPEERIGRSRNTVADLQMVLNLVAAGSVLPEVADVALRTMSGALGEGAPYDDFGFPSAIGDGGLFGEWEAADRSVSLLVPPQVEHAYIYCHSDTEDRTFRHVTGNTLAAALRWLYTL